jgi:SLT domain-containing protein
MRDFVEITYDIIEHESGWNHAAVSQEQGRSFESDGAHSDACRGLAQLRPPVFAQYHAPGTSANIYDPVASIAALWLFIADQFDVNLTTGAVLQVFIDLWVSHPETWWDRASNPPPDVVAAEII